jgi:hypothetical protein
MEDDDTVAGAAAPIHLDGDVYAATRKCSLHRIEACGAYQTKIGYYQAGRRA